MAKTQDPVLAHILDFGFADGLADHLARAAHEAGHLILSAAELSDVTVVGPITHWVGPPSRYGVGLEGKWYITFYWDDELGAFDLALERR